MKISNQNINILNSELLGLTLMSEQDEVLNGVWKNDNSVIATNRGWGRTFMLSNLAL
jgi:hypothetical protein